MDKDEQIKALQAEVERLRNSNAALINDTVLMGMARDAAEAKAESYGAALELAANRLNRCAVEAIADGKRFSYEWSEWADEARVALTSTGGDDENA